MCWSYFLCSKLCVCCNILCHYPNNKSYFQDISRSLLWTQRHHQTWPQIRTDMLTKPIDLLMLNQLKETYCEIKVSSTTLSHFVKILLYYTCTLLLSLKNFLDWFRALCHRVQVRLTIHKLVAAPLCLSIYKFLCDFHNISRTFQTYLICMLLIKTTGTFPSSPSVTKSKYSLSLQKLLNKVIYFI